MGLEFPRSLMKLGKFPLKGTHLFLRLLKLWLPLSKVPVTSDKVLVLACVHSIHTVRFSLYLLLSINLFLTVHSSISRVNCVACLGLPLLEQRDSVVLYFVSLEEHDKAGNMWGYLQILDFSEDMHMFFHYTQLAFLCNCCYLKPYPPSYEGG